MRPARYEGSEEDVQHLTWVTKARASLFDCPDRARVCLEAMDRERVRLKVEVFAYALMPDHFHVVIGPAPFPVGTVVQWMKLASAYWLKDSGLIDGSPWARGFWDRAVRDSRQLRTAIEYVHGIALNAGLIEDLDDYPFSSYRFYEYDEAGIISVTKPSIW